MESIDPAAQGLSALAQEMGRDVADSLFEHVTSSFSSRLEQLICLMIGGDFPTLAPQTSADDWVAVEQVTAEEWLSWTGLEQYSGLFAQARVHEGTVYLHSYTGNWFQLAGVRVTDELLIDHTPRLHQLSPT